MAKIREIPSEKTLKKISFDSAEMCMSHSSSVGRFKIDEDDVDSKIDTTINMVKSSIFKIPGIYDVDENGEAQEETFRKKSDDQHIKDPVSKLGGGEAAAEDAPDDKTNYDAESFCSDGSYKESEVTNVTPRSSLSGCSSLFQTTGLKYDKQRLGELKGRKCREQACSLHHLEDEDGLGSLENEIRYLSMDDIPLDRRQGRSGRRNMSFTNEEMRKIERENQLLLRKIMSHQKPQNKSVKQLPTQQRTSSSAINRRKLQKKIEEDNMLLLRRIQQTKSCALPRTTTPGYRLTLI